MPYNNSLIITEQELNIRINSLKNKLIENNINYAVIFLNANLFYFTGIVQQGFLLIKADDEPIYFVKKNYNIAEKFSSIKSVIRIKSTKDILNYIKPGQVLGLELDILPYNNVKFYESLLQPSKIQDISLSIREIRAVKSSKEIEYIKKAANQLKILCNDIAPYVKAGIKEYELFGKVQEILIKSGHQGLTKMHGFNQEMFYGHVISGKNSLLSGYLDAPTNGSGLYPSFPQGSGENVLQDNSIVSIDIVGCFNGYHADQTRPFAIGDPNKLFFDNFKKALEIEQSVVNYIKPGKSWESAYFKGLETAKKLKVENMFMGLEDKVKFIGHGIGVELDEFPFLSPGFKKEFLSGMTFAIEPKIFIPDQGMIGIENSYLITEKGCEKLTSVPDAIIH